MALEHDSDSPLALAVRKAGSQTAFGRLIGKRQSVINDWLRLEKPLPVEDVETVSRSLNIPAHQLRPDLAHLFTDPVPPAAGSPSAAGSTPGADALAGLNP